MVLLRSLVLSIAMAAASMLGASSEQAELPCEQAITTIPLSAGLERPDAEISGLAWYGDELVLLPQYPARLGGSLYAMPRASIEAWLGGDGDAPEPRAVPIVAPGLEELPGFEGYEAIAFAGAQVFVAVEAEVDHPEGLLMRGKVVGDLERIELDVAGRVSLAPQSDIENLAYEALAVHGDRVMVFYETNGANNGQPRVRVFDRDLRPAGDAALGRVEYRVTDVTEVDAEGRFWAVNYFWPGADWQPGDCPIAARFGLGASHAKSRTVERLVELRVTADGVVPTDAPPIQLELDPESPRNWEGVVRLGSRGFLVVTDEHPTSMLAFVPAA